MIFRERKGEIGVEEERKRKRRGGGEGDVRSTDRLPPIRAPTRDQSCNLGMCPDQEWRPKPFDVQDNTPTN